MTKASPKSFQAPKKLRIKISAKVFFYMLCGLLTILLLGGSYAYWWGREELIIQKDRVNKKQLELVDGEKHTEQLVQLSRRYTEASARLNGINEALPRQSQQAEILLQIKEAANQSQVSLPSLQFTGAASPTNSALNQATPVEGLYILPISLRLSGTYDQLQTFLERLERLGRYNSVTSLSTTKTLTNRDQLDISMTLVAYLKP